MNPTVHYHATHNQEGIILLISEVVINKATFQVPIDTEVNENDVIGFNHSELTRMYIMHSFNVRPHNTAPKKYKIIECFLRPITPSEYGQLFPLRNHN
jgi:hypothetical protein